MTWRIGAVMVTTVLVAASALAASPVLGHPSEPGPRPGRIANHPTAHDPSVVKEGRYYYSFSTGEAESRTYLPVRRSTDLLHWTLVGPVFTTAPAWVTNELGLTPADFWAPDITYFDGLYHLYYAASVFGTNNSVIGLATTPTLDPADPRHGWVDRGLVMRSSPTDTFNAIDPDVVFDQAGTPWLSFGSFWDGILIRRLDRSTGRPADTTPQLIASRGGASIEGPSIVWHDGYYYLFASLDYCCRGVDSDYRLVVGRATAITGPYLDRDGTPMLAGGGTDLLRGYNEFRGTGGGDVFTDRRGDLFAHHYYDTADAGRPKLSIRPVTWAGGWPALGDPLSGSSQVGHGTAWFRLVNQATGGVVSNPSCGYEGADVRIAQPSTSPCQQWRLDEHADGYQSLLNRSSNKVAEVAACVNTDGARIGLWGWLNNDCQKYQARPAGDGWSTLENKLAGRVLEAAACGGVGTTVQAFTWLDNSCQRFRLDPVGDVLIADSAGGQVLDAKACRPVSGSPVRPAARRDSACQLWRFEPSEGGYFQIVNQGVHRPLGTEVGRDGSVRLVIGGAGQPTTRTQWRIEPLDAGGYRLTNMDGQTAVLPDGAEGLRLLTP